MVIVVVERMMGISSMDWDFHSDGDAIVVAADVVAAGDRRSWATKVYWCVDDAVVVVVVVVVTAHYYSYSLHAAAAVVAAVVGSNDAEAAAGC